ncbi:MAG: hypothetical protein WDW38_005992 [Sanguina aurantia]
MSTSKSLSQHAGSEAMPDALMQHIDNTALVQQWRERQQKQRQQQQQQSSQPPPPPMYYISEPPRTFRVNADSSAQEEFKCCEPPETMASSVATPLEAQLSTIAGISQMSSTSALGSTSITPAAADWIQHRRGACQESRGQDRGSLAAALADHLPTPPTFRKAGCPHAPIIYIAVTSATLPLSRVDDYGETELAQQLSMVDGVAQVSVYGSQKYAVRVNVNPDRLAAAGIGIDTVQAAITAANVNQSTGSLYGSRQQLPVSSDGQLMRAAAYNDIVVAYRNGSPVRLGNVGRAEDSVQNDQSASWFNGNRSILLAIQRQPGANTVDTVDHIKALLPGFTATLPPSVKLDVLYDRSQSIRASVEDVQFTLLLAGVLTRSDHSSMYQLPGPGPVFQKNTPQCQTYLKASQSAVVRLDRNTDPGIGGLCTDGMSACVCMIFQNPDGRMALTHTDLTVSGKSMLREVEWVGPPCSVTVVRGCHYGDPAKERQYQFRSFWVPHMEKAIKDKGMNWVRIGRPAPMIDFRHSITNMNHAIVNMEGGMFDLDVQYDATRWTKFPLLYPRTAASMSQLEQGGLPASRLKARITQQDGPMAVANFEEAVRDVRLHRDRAEQDLAAIGVEAQAAYEAAKYQAAADLYEHCSVLSAILRPEPTYEARTALHNVGRAYMQMGDFQWGAVYMRQSLDVARQNGAQMGRSLHATEPGCCAAEWGAVYMRQSLDVARQLVGLGAEHVRKVEARLEECERHLAANKSVPCTTRKQHP